MEGFQGRFERGSMTDRNRKVLVIFSRFCRKWPVSYFLHSGLLTNNKTVTTSKTSTNSKHWFTTSFLGGRCRKVMLGVWDKQSVDSPEYRHFQTEPWRSTWRCVTESAVKGDGTSAADGVPPHSQRQAPAHLPAPRGKQPPADLLGHALHPGHVRHLHRESLLWVSGIFHGFIYEWLFTRMFICCCCS